MILSYSNTLSIEVMGYKIHSPHFVQKMYSIVYSYRIVTKKGNFMLKTLTLEIICFITQLNFSAGEAHISSYEPIKDITLVTALPLPPEQPCLHKMTIQFKLQCNIM